MIHAKFGAALALAATLGVGSASAADLGGWPYKAAPLPYPGYNWAGFYIGADVGGDWIRGNAFTSFNQNPGLPTGLGAFNQSRAVTSSGVIGGLYTGYNWQASNWLFGVEADISALGNSNTKATAPDLAFPSGALLAGGFVFGRSQDLLSTVRGRVGIVAAPNLLLYVAGGAAFADNHYTASFTEPGGGVWRTDFRKAQTGYTVGGGAEWMATQNWILRAEYLYVSLPGASVVTTSPAFASTVIVPFNWSRTDEHIGRVGIAYKFSGPIVARY